MTTKKRPNLIWLEHLTKNNQKNTEVKSILKKPQRHTTKKLKPVTTGSTI